MDCVLTRVQREVGEWAQQFGDNPSHHPDYDGVKLFSIPPFLGMVEEIGEMAGPMAKLHQGRGYADREKYKEAIRDGLADLLIFACDFARREKISLAEALSNVWETVKKRRQATWEQDKAKEVHQTPPVVLVVPNQWAQTGQGWAEPPEDPAVSVVEQSGYITEQPAATRVLNSEVWYQNRWWVVTQHDTRHPETPWKIQCKGAVKWLSDGLLRKAIAKAAEKRQAHA